MTLTAAAAVLIGAPLLAGSAASAESAGDVTFTGDCGLLGLTGGDLHAEVEEVSVPAGSGVRFTNGLDKDATLELDGKPAAQVPAGGSADVVFNDGPVQATMHVKCTLGKADGTVTVDVVPAPAQRDERPSSDDASPRPSRGPASPSTPPDQSSQRPTTAPPAGQQPPPASPGSGAQPGAEMPGDWGAMAPGGPGMPGGPGDGAAGAPDGAEPADEPDRERGSRWELTDPANGGDGSPDPATVDTQAEDQLAADQVSRTAGSGPDDGPIGLLALVATVCVVGVAAGAVRALVSRRTVRA